jgi:hypothetical protein
VDVAGEADPGFANAYLSDVAGLPRLRLEGDPGRLALALEIKGGRVEDGASITYRSPRAGVRFPWFTALGDLELDGASSGGKLAVDVTVSRALLQRETLVVHSDRLTIAATADSDLRRMPFVDAVVTLTDARVPDLRALDELMPAGPALRIAQGRGRVDATLVVRSSPPAVHGHVLVRAEQIVLRNRGATIEGRMELRARVRALDLDTGTLDLSGTTLRLDKAVVRAGAVTWAGQWLHLQLERCLFDLRGPVLWRTELDVAASNLQPLYALLAANLDIPRALGLFTDSPDAHLVARLELRADRVSVPSLRLTSKHVGLDGVIDVKPTPGAPQQQALWGWAVVRLGAVQLGFELEGSKVTLGDAQRLSSRVSRP